MKTCSQCKTEKPVSEFRKRSNRKDGYCSWCKICHRKYEKDRYTSNPNMRAKMAANAKVRYERLGPINRRLMLRYLKDHPCVDCGETHPAVLEFDHVRGTKKKGITVMLTTYKWETILTEIEKCVVRCANCHAKKTAIERNYYTANGFDGLE